MSPPLAVIFGYVPPGPQGLFPLLHSKSLRMPITLGLAQANCQDGIGSGLKSEVWLLIRLLTFPELLLCAPEAVPAPERCHHDVGVSHSHGFWESPSSVLGTGLLWVVTGAEQDRQGRGSS